MDNTSAQNNLQRAVLIQPRRFEIFLSSLFFVLGFSVVFSLVGVLLQTVLTDVSYTVKEWLGYIGGVIIIVFGLFVLKLFTPKFLQYDHKFAVRFRFKSHYLTSFVFGAAFAVGWTPCVSAALGAILALATTSASGAFLLLIAYTLGIGVPFIIVGLFTERAQRIINHTGKWLNYIQYFFGALLILLGVLVFTGQLSRISNFQFLSELLGNIGLTTSFGENISSLTLINFIVALAAGLGSFLSPCILPLVPGFLSYLASSTMQQKSTPA